MSAIALDIPRSRKWTWVQVIGALIAALSMLILSGGGGSVDEGGGDPPSASSACDGQTITDYIRDGGTGDGDAWNDALDALPATLASGGYYFVADGTYASYTFDDNAATVCKATVADHGTETGWLDTYGDGQAVWGTITVKVDDVVIDGGTRDEDDWGDATAYGFNISGVRTSTFENSGNLCPDNLVVRYSDLSIGSSGSPLDDESLYIGGFQEACTGWLIERNFLGYHTDYAMVQCVGCYGITFQYNRFHEALGKETIRGQNDFDSNVIRWNEFYNACGHGIDIDQQGGLGCTAEIAAWGATGDWDDNQIYGNYFYRDIDENSGGTIVIGGNGGSWPGSSASNTLVYNNTFAGKADGTQMGTILINGGSGNVCRNNLHYDTESTTISCSTSSNNVDAGADPFVTYAAGADLHLSAATAAGFTLASPYDVDMDGVTRGADGNWDVGAFEYVAP